MNRRHAIALVVVLSVVAVVTVFVRRQPLKDETNGTAVGGAAGEIMRLVDEVESSRATNGYFSESSKLRKPDLQTLEIMMEEVESLGVARNSKSNESTVVDRSMRIRKAFEIAGGKAARLIPSLRTNFLSGQNPGDSGWALLHIGSEAWPVLVAGLSNNNATVQTCAADLVGYLPQEFAVAAVPGLLSVLTNGTVVTRTMAAGSIGRIGIASEIAVAALSYSLTNDPAWEVRMTAARALGSYVANSDAAKKALLSARLADSEDIVRRVAEEAIRKGTGSSNVSSSTGVWEGGGSRQTDKSDE